MIKLIKSSFYRESDTKRKLCDFIRTAKQLSFGSKCEQFEKAFAAWQGRKHCVMLNSGSSANLAVIQALLNIGKLKKGDGVGFSAVTWSTNVMPLLQLGLVPIAVDVELDTLNVSARLLEKALKKKSIKALFLTNLLGFCGDIDRISAVCKRNGILLLEDNCESLGTVYKGKKLGNFGAASTFSFYVGHHMSTVEGGAVCTDDESLATMLRLVRAHGWDRNLTFAKQEEMRKQFRVNSTFYSRYTFYDLGYNFRPTEMNGYAGLLQLKHLNEIVAKRQHNFLRIAKAVYAHEDRYFPLRYDHIDIVSNFAVPIVCKSQMIRDELVARCDGKIEIRPIVGGDMTRQPFFGRYAKPNGDGTNAQLIHDQGLYFGNNPELTESDLRTIVRIFAS